MADPTAGGGTEGLRADLVAFYLAQHHLRGTAELMAGQLVDGPLADFLARASAEQARVDAERDGWSRRAEAAEAENALLKKHIGALRDALDRSEARYAEAQNGPKG